MALPTDPAAEFEIRARAVSARVLRVADASAALDRVLALCTEDDACAVSPSGCAEPLSDGAADLCETKPARVIAAPGLDPEILADLDARCRTAGATLVTDGMRSHPSGVDIGLTRADFGIAETGTLVIDSADEDLRLATMICETHVVLLPVSRIFPTCESIGADLAEMIGRAPGYTAFITGASRTADIERVLALGVHGPLTLHIFLLES